MEGRRASIHSRVSSNISFPDYWMGSVTVASRAVSNEVVILVIDSGLTSTSYTWTVNLPAGGGL
jgi:hypothetical protein